MSSDFPRGSLRELEDCALSFPPDVGFLKSGFKQELRRVVLFQIMVDAVPKLE
jgi:hypothetical protein